MSALRRPRRARDTDIRWGRLCTRRPDPAEAFRRWLEDIGTSPDQAATIAATATAVEDWLCRHRLSVLGANDADVCAFQASSMGTMLGDAAMDALWMLKRWGQEELGGWALELGG
jgi:hypothetical protein